MIDTDTFFAQYLSPKQRKLSSLALTSAQIKLSPQRIYERDTKTFLKPGQSHSVQSLSHSAKALELRDTQRIDTHETLSLEHKIREQSREIGQKETIIVRLQTQVQLQQDTMVYQQTKLDQLEQSQLEYQRSLAHYGEKEREWSCQLARMAQEHEQSLNQSQSALLNLQQQYGELQQSFRIESSTMQQQFQDSIASMRQQLKVEANEKIVHLELEIQVEQLEHRLRTTEKELAVKDSRVVRLQGDVHDLEQAHRAHLEEIDQLRLTVHDGKAQQEQRVAELSKRWADAEQQRDQQARQLKEQANTFQQQLSEAQETFKDHARLSHEQMKHRDGQIAGLQGQLRDAEDAGRSLTEQLKVRNEDKKLMTETIATTTQRLQELEEYALQLREDADTECRGYRAQLLQLKSEHELHNLQLSKAFDRESAELHERIKRQGEQMLKLQTELSAKDQETESLNRQLIELDQIVQSQRVSLDESQQSIEFLQQNTALLKKQFDSRVQLDTVKWESKLQSLQQTKDHETKTLEQQIALLKGQVQGSALQHDRELATRVHALQQQLIQAEQQLAQKSHALAERDGELASRAAEHQIAVTQLKARLDAIEEQLAAKEALLSTKEAHIVRLATKLQESECADESQLKLLRSQVPQLLSQLEATKGQCSQLKIQNDTLQVACQEAMDKDVQCESQRQADKFQHQTLLLQVTKDSQQQIVHLNAEIEGLQQRVKEHESKLNRQEHQRRDDLSKLKQEQEARALSENERKAMQTKYEETLTQLKNLYTLGRDAEIHMADLQQELKTKSDELGQHQQLVVQLEQELIDMRGSTGSTLLKLQTENHRLGEQCSQLRVQYEREGAQNMKLQAMIENVSRQHLELQEHYKHYETKRATINPFKVQLAEQQEMLATQAQQLQEYAQSIEELQAACNQLRHQCDSKIQQGSLKEVRIAELEGQLAEINDKAAQQLNSEIARAQVEKATLQRIISNSEKQVTSLTSEIAGLHTQLQQHQAQYSTEIGQVRSKFQGEIAKLQAEFREKEGLIIQLQLKEAKHLQEQESSAAMLTLQLNQREREVEHLERQSSEQAQLITSLKKEVSRHQQLAQQLDQELQQLRTEAEQQGNSQQHQVQKLTQALRKQQETYAELQTEFKAVSQQSHEALTLMECEHRRREQETLTSAKATQQDIAIRLQIYEMKNSVLRKLALKLVQSVEPKYQEEAGSTLEDLMEVAVQGVKQLRGVKRGKENMQLRKRENDFMDSSDQY